MAGDVAVAHLTGGDAQQVPGSAETYSFTNTFRGARQLLAATTPAAEYEPARVAPGILHSVQVRFEACGDLIGRRCGQHPTRRGLTPS